LEGVYYLMALRNFDGQRNGNVVEFKLLNPYNIRRVLSGDQLTVAGYVETRKGKIRELPVEMIIPIWDLNPFDEDKPFSMGDAASEAQFTLRTAGDYTRHSLRHNINAPGILSTDVILPEEDFKQFTERVKNNTKGEPLFGNGKGAITWDSMNVELSKAALKDVNDMNRQALFAVAGESKTTMGIEESGTTRETARVQRELNMEDHILPRIQLIIDALNLDYLNRYPDQFKSNEAFILVDNPMAIDHENDLKETKVKQGQYDLYISLINRGYESELAAKFVQGEVTLDQLGEPTKEPMIDPNVRAKLQLEEEPVENQVSQSGLIQQQEGALKNAIVNAETQLTAEVVRNLASKKTKNDIDFDVVSLLSDATKRGATNEIIAILTQFYGIVFSFEGTTQMRRRLKEFGLSGQFTLGGDAKLDIKNLARKVADSHVDTISNDLLTTVREAALKGDSIDQIIDKVTTAHSSEITKTRATTIARTETNRAFTRAQYEADRQFIEQNNLQGRVFKQWRTRSDNPCPFCEALEAEGPKPFFDSFRDLGDTIKAGDQVLEIGFEALEAGNAHPNCACQYELIIHQDNALSEMEKKYEEMDKRTKEAKQLLEDIKKRQEKLDRDRAEFDKELDQIDSLIPDE